MPQDFWSARYLAPIFWLAPISLAPLANALGARRLLVVLAPYLLGCVIAGWLGFGAVSRSFPFVPPRAVAQEVQDRALLDLLRAEKIKAGAANYWLAYRLTYLWNEEVTLIPLNPLASRYAPYVDRFEQAPRVALIFDPAEPRDTPAEYVQAIERAGWHIRGEQAGTYQVLVVEKTPQVPTNRGTR
jgi:hypothetical protein